MAFNPADHMMNLKGKEYLQVMWRLVWFREEHPDWSVQTMLCDHDRETQTAIFKAEIYDKERCLSTGWGSECRKDFNDYLEKAETKAVGRALAMLGYGTQFAPDLDEGERIVDSPVARKQSKKTITPMQKVDILRELNRTGITKDTICQNYGVQQIDDILAEMFPDIMKRFSNTPDKA